LAGGAGDFNGVDNLRRGAAPKIEPLVGVLWIPQISGNKLGVVKAG
jgi:hypothetical protein